MQGLAPLEWNYFQTEEIELCVTPEAPFEITQGQPLASLPWTAYQRFKKSQLFKRRPSGARLSLTEQDANVLWNGIGDILWPTIANHELTKKQRADVSELYFHTISNSTLAHSAFLTGDGDFLRKAETISGQLGVVVMTPTEAWEEYQPKVGLYEPSPAEVSHFVSQQRTLLQQLSTRSQW